MKSKDEISGLVTGAVASDYQKTRFDNMCDAIGLKTYSPLWHKNPRLLVDDLKKSGFRIILTAVAARPRRIVARPRTHRSGMAQA